MAEISITYYKLESNYPNDYTKKCSLEGEEIDSNFYFLRGYDFSSITFEEGIITLTRLNGEQLTADTSSYIESGTTKIDFSGTTFNPETGELLLVINGKECCIEGFNTLAESAITMIEQEIAIRESEFGQLDEGQSALTETLLNEIEERKSKDNDFSNKIENLDNRLTAETCERKVRDNELTSGISAETKDRIDADTILYNTLVNQGSRITILETSAHTHENKSVLDSISNERVNNWDNAESNAKNYTDNKINVLDANILGESHDVKVNIKQENGKVTELNVKAPDFPNLYDTKGAAESAEASAKSYANEKYSAATAYTYGQVSTETEARASADATLSNRIAAETSARETSVSNEENARIVSDNALSTRISALETLSGQSHTHNNKDVLDGITAEKVTAWESASAYTDNAINTEKEEREAAVSGEAATREAKDNKLTSALNAETAARESAMAAEAAAREEKDNELASAITTEIVRATAKESEIEKLTKIEKNITISKYNPLYNLVKGIWDNNTIPSGTTLTEFIEKLLTTEDKNMIYITSTSKKFNEFIKAKSGSSRCLEITDDFSSSTVANAMKDNGVDLIISEEDICQIIVIPSTRYLIKTSLEGNLIADLEASDFTKIQLPLILNGIMTDTIFSIYYYETDVNNGDNQTLNIRIG